MLILYTTQFHVGQLLLLAFCPSTPASYGLLGQETKGPGEIFKALRTIPVILAIIEDMKMTLPQCLAHQLYKSSGYDHRSCFALWKLGKSHQDL